jgi:hypothetical protein
MIKIFLQTLLTIASVQTLFSQNIGMFSFPEPTKPVMPASSNVVVRGFYESVEDYEKRLNAIKTKNHIDYLNGASYRSWLKTHEIWRGTTKNWKTITRYPEFKLPSDPNSRTSPLSVVGNPYFVNALTLNLRNAPEANSSVSKTLKLGEYVQLVSVVDGTWWEVTHDTFRGYVSAKYLVADMDFGWEAISYSSGATPECYNVQPRYDYTINNYLEISVGSNTDVVVKLMTANGYAPECIRIVYVRSNETYRMENIPEGRYTLKVAYGRDFRQKVVNNQCYVKFMQNAQYEQGVQVLDFNKIKKPNTYIDGKEYENTQIPSYKLSLDVKWSTEQSRQFVSKDMSETEFNR